MNDRLPAPGRFVRYRDVAYRLLHSPDKWWIASDHAVDESFTRTGRRYFVKHLGPDDVLDCYDLARPGTYRGLAVEVLTTTPQAYVVTTLDQRAGAEGFARADHRGPLEKLVAFDDPELRFTTELTPVRAPWQIAHAWELFAERLTDALRDVTDRVFLVIHAADDPKRYVQFAAGPDRLDAEAPGADVVADALEFLLRRFGWVEPGVAQPNWTSSLRRPALTAEFAQLARRCVVALNKSYGITSPDDLRYRAWHEPVGAQTAAVKLPGLGLD
ncbi:hypothetical protein AB0A63_27530 [Lentzea sp. NPDC042327]|uniref:TY-Chap domain-containing protein n=1 Tax=Lentzea sp. NPDC042327 TaxID=3154801 RepID=UPI0033E9C8C8